METPYSDYFGTHYERTCTTPSGGGGYSADLIALPNGGNLVAAEEQNRQGSYFTGYDSAGNFQYSGGATLTNPVNIAAGATAQPQTTAPVVRTAPVQAVQTSQTSTNPAPQTQQAPTVQAGVVPATSSGTGTTAQQIASAGAAPEEATTEGGLFGLDQKTLLLIAAGVAVMLYMRK